MSYLDIMAMPVFKLSEYIEWKLKYDNDKERAKAKNLEDLK